jgi:death on curing protein
MSLGPDFLALEEVLDLHERQLARYGGAGGVRSRGGLESAAAMPAQTFGGAFVHEDIPAMAAAYAFHIAQNQPFVDGNKRTGLAAALVFLELNDISPSDREGRLYDAMIALAERRLDKAGLAAVLGGLPGGPPRGPGAGGRRGRFNEAAERVARDHDETFRKLAR